MSTGEPDARKSGTSGSEGGRRKRTSTTGTSSAAYPTTRRLYEILTSQGRQANQQVTFLTDGGEDIPDLPLYLNPQAEHLLDWFPVTMRITVMTTMAKSLRSPPPDPDLPPSPPADLAADVATQLESLKWFCWHGTVFRALRTVQDLEIDLDGEEPHIAQTKLLKAVREFDSYLRANAARIPHYGERRRAGEAISTSFVESTVNQVISRSIDRTTGGHADMVMVLACR